MTRFVKEAIISSTDGRISRTFTYISGVDIHSFLASYGNNHKDHTGRKSLCDFDLNSVAYQWLQCGHQRAIRLHSAGNQPLASMCTPENHQVANDASVPSPGSNMLFQFMLDAFKSLLWPRVCPWSKETLSSQNKIEALPSLHLAISLSFSGTCNSS